MGERKHLKQNLHGALPHVEPQRGLKRIDMSQVAFSLQITIQVLRQAMESGDKTYGIHEHSFAVLEHVRRLGIAGLIAVGEPCGKVAIHVSSITPAGEAILAWLSESEASMAQCREAAAK
jgi:hypothetical protein